MVEYSIVPAEPQHLRQLCAALRAEDRYELTCLGFKPMVALRRSFRGALFRRTAFVDGAIAAMWGVQGCALGGVGQPWLLTTEAIERAPGSAFLREARREIAAMLDVYDRLENFVVADYARAWRFMQLLGFSVSMPVPYGPRGTLHRLITLERPPVSDGAPFIVYGLPRSRTLWLSRFLAYDGRTVHHDLPLSVTTLGELVTTLQPMSGTVETALARAAWILREAVPRARVAVVRRPVEEVRASAARIGWHFPQGYLEAEDAQLAEIASHPDVLSVDFADLASEAGCRSIFEHCLGEPFDRAWWHQLDAQNIQVDPVDHLALVARRHDPLVALFGEIDARVRIQLEDFETFYRDGQDLFAEAYAEAGGFADLPFDPNIEMMRTLAAADQLIVVTARNSAGMVGYLVFLISQCFESRHVLLGFQNLFFVRRGHRGRLGQKLHAAARAELKARGVTMLVMRAGVRASSAKQKHLFARLGAIDMGNLYYLKMRD